MGGMVFGFAIENECIVFGVNRTGLDGNKIKYGENSVMVMPDGSVGIKCFKSSMLHIYDIDKYEVEEYRNNFSTIKDKSHCLYEDIIRESNKAHAHG